MSQRPKEPSHQAHDGAPAPVSISVSAGQGRLARRLLLTGGIGAATAAAVGAAATPAAAASSTTAWVMGGNSGVNTDGSNYIGTRNVAPVIVKTTPSSGATPLERIRVTASGLVGIGNSKPVAKLDVKTGYPTAILGVTSNSAAGSIGVDGSAPAGTGVRGAGQQAGLQGKGSYYGVIAEATSGTGAYASGSGTGVYALGASYGLVGYASSGTGAYTSGGIGTRAVGTTYGVDASASDPNGAGVHGTGGQYAVRGESGRTAGVRGDSGYVGLWGQAPTYGVFALATDAGTAQTYGLFAQASNASSFAVFAQGRLHVNGTLSKAAGSFQIDHPLDPDNSWLSHSFVESPDMMNVYNGNVVLDASGGATVTLPAYFEALNRDFRYQLTTIGGFAPVYVSKQVQGNTFQIAGGTAGLTVSWQVTGIRKDDYAAANPIVVERRKSAAERGSRQFVAPGSSARQWAPAPAAPTPMARTDVAAPSTPDLPPTR